MPPLVQEAYWKAPNVYDTISVIGFVVGVGSVWLSWRWARADIRRRLEEASERAAAAAREEIQRVAKSLLQVGVADTIRSLELAREACDGRRWPRAVELCEFARNQLSRMLAQAAFAGSTESQMRATSAIILDCITALRKQPRPNVGKAPGELLNSLGQAITDLHRVDGELRAIPVEDKR